MGEKVMGEKLTVIIILNFKLINNNNIIIIKL